MIEGFSQTLGDWVSRNEGPPRLRCELMSFGAPSMACMVCVWCAGGVSRGHVWCMCVVRNQIWVSCLLITPHPVSLSLKTFPRKP